MILLDAQQYIIHPAKYAWPWHIWNWGWLVLWDIFEVIVKRYSYFFTTNSTIPLVDSISVTCAPIFWIWSLAPHFMAYLGTLVGYGNSLWDPRATRTLSLRQPSQVCLFPPFHGIQWQRHCELPPLPHEKEHDGTTSLFSWYKSNT